MRLTLVFLAAMLAFTGFGGPERPAYAIDCLPWSQARPIISKNGLIGSEQASALAQRKHPGEVLVNVKFCRSGSEYFYLVSLLRQDNNQVRRVMVDAASGRL